MPECYAFANRCLKNNRYPADTAVCMPGNNLRLLKNYLKTPLHIVLSTVNDLSAFSYKARIKG